MNTEEIRKTIVKNSEEVARLHRRIHDTFKLRDKSSDHREKWSTACSEFHRRYDQLAFPGGLEGAYERILSGDAFAIEAGLCFLELRPYFFRSGYIYKDLVRKLKRANLSLEQEARFEEFLRRMAEWKRRRQNGA